MHICLSAPAQEICDLIAGTDILLVIWPLLFVTLGNPVLWLFWSLSLPVNMLLCYIQILCPLCLCVNVLLHYLWIWAFLHVYWIRSEMFYVNIRVVIRVIHWQTALIWFHYYVITSSSNGFGTDEFCIWKNIIWLCLGSFWLYIRAGFVYSEEIWVSQPITSLWCTSCNIVIWLLFG